MVHALEIAHSLLKPGGLLIDIHPNGDPPPVEVHMGSKVLLAGHLQETDDFVEYFQADDALAQVTARGLFELEREASFPFMVHALTTQALTDFLANEWSDAILSETVSERLAALMTEPVEGKEIVVREIIRIARYRKGGAES
jgi:hypothetical protein